MAPDYMWKDSEEELDFDVSVFKPVNKYCFGVCLEVSVFMSICCLLMWGNMQTVTVCFTVCILISGFMNIGVSFVRKLQNMSTLLSTNRQLEKEKRVAIEENNFKTIFIAKVSHELRTPLHAVMCCCDLISDTLLTQEQSGFLKIISKSSDLLLSLINNILDLSKAESGKMILEMRRFSLHECLENVVLTMKTKTPQKFAKKPKIDLKIDEQVPDYIIGDEIRLTQVV
jgi:signal transduction histidine kinase